MKLKVTQKFFLHFSFPEAHKAVAMAELLGAFGKAISSFLELKQVSIDNWSFKLFYKVTTSLLLVCSVLVTAR